MEEVTFNNENNLKFTILINYFFMNSKNTISTHVSLLFHENNNNLQLST